MTPPLDRRSAVLLLLDSLLDYLPAVKSATGQLAASGGTAVGTVVSCPRCDGSGREIVERWDTGQKRQVPCGDCKGSGSREAKRGETGTDPMIDRTAKGLSAIKGRGMERVELDAEIARLERSRRDRAGERSGRDAYGWERERQAARKVGSYAELERALEWLREVAPARCYRAWRFVYHFEVDGWSEGVWGAFGETLEMLASQMPERIKVPPALLEHGGPAILQASGRWADGWVQAERDRSIRHEYREGVRQAALAARYGISQGRVSQIVATTMGAT